MIKISTNSRRRFMSKIVRKNDQSNPLRKVGECLYRNGHGVYFAWFSVRGKQLKRSLKTSDKELARRRLAELRKIAARLHGSENRNLRFEEVVRSWLESIQGGLKTSTYRRRVVCINQLMPFFKTIPMRSITSADIEKWKLRRGVSIAARTFNKELETLNHVIRYARDVKGILLDNPAEKVRNRKAAVTTIGIPSKDQFRGIVAELRNEPQAVRSGAAVFGEFLTYSGLRLGEGREVRWRDVNFELNTLLVAGGETRKKILETVRPLPSRRLPLLPALGCFTADDYFAQLPLPMFDNSAMDGYAVVASSSTKGARLRVTGEQPAGPDRRLPISPGEAVRIFTGAPVPQTADAIVMQEDVTRKRNEIVVNMEVNPRDFIRRRCCDLAEGRRIL